jgi:hypothetical protein
MSDAELNACGWCVHHTMPGCEGISLTVRPTVVDGRTYDLCATCREREEARNAASLPAGGVARSSRDTPEPQPSLDP